MYYYILHTNKRVKKIFIVAGLCGVESMKKQFLSVLAVGR